MVVRQRVKTPDGTFLLTRLRSNPLKLNSDRDGVPDNRELRARNAFLVYTDPMNRDTDP